MIDFVDYVVSQLKSKKLCKTDALALIQQFAAGSGKGGVIHPLLHRNTSDLGEQRFSSTFTGDESFLTDHQVKAGGHNAEKVLPGVAYLEMARVAIEQSSPLRPETALLELRNTVWAQPIRVSGKRQVSIALSAIEPGQIDYEIYSQEGQQEVLHCKGRAAWSEEPAPGPLDLDDLRGQMQRARRDPDAVYAGFAQMGFLYGPSHRAITALYVGENQLLAQLRLPAIVKTGCDAYVLHPSLLDGALQSCVGLMDDLGPRLARMPFALESLRVVSPCTADMFAWVRYAPGTRASETVIKLDIDLCDDRGNFCVQMRGFSSRLLDAPEKIRGSLLAIPAWEPSPIAESSSVEYMEHHVVLCGVRTIDPGQLESLVPHSKCLYLPGGEQEESIAQRYSECALACFARIQGILRSKSGARVLVQIVVAGNGEQLPYAGLWGLLKTAALENPWLTGQLILCPAEIATTELAGWLQQEKSSGRDQLIRYEVGQRQRLAWREVAAEREEPPIAFKEDGVYLITGGLGGLGLLFAKEILEQTGGARVVLTGRSALSRERQALLEQLSAQTGRVSYRQLDLGDFEQVKQLIASVEQEHQQLNGIIHSAGMIADNFILKKGAAEFSNVLGPKVVGTYNLDQATRQVALDFFVLFSSAAGALGNVGQADYAAANGFMDQFAAYRNGEVASQRRQGRTRSINWGLWQAGGMGVDAASLQLLQQTTGMQPMQTAAGIAAFYRSLALPCDQILAMEGDLPQLRRALHEAPSSAPIKEPIVASALDAQTLYEKTQDYLRTQFSGLLKLPPYKIDPMAGLERYGIDSILAMKLTNQLEQTFGSLAKTLFFEYQTIQQLTDYFIAHYPSQLAALFATTGPAMSKAAPPAELDSGRRPGRVRRALPSVTESNGRTESDPIAIIGLSGRYPEAVNIEAYWQNLREGKDCIVEVPRERWDWQAYFSDDRTRGGHHFSKWGGFIAGVDEFDPLFFNISPADAEYIDPQERLFLQHAWMAVEDAGYTRGDLQAAGEQDPAAQVGVYVGLMYTEYQLFAAEASARGKQLGVGVSAASIANRVSYTFNLHGPSMTLDTMCSSSLTAIHLACEDLKQRRTRLAIAGGVNVSIHPNKYLVLSAGQFISSDGHCQSFGEGGDGYIPGEGVGVVVLKRLSEAQRAGDHIYGIIRGCALNHGGKTNGYTVPNPQSQASAIGRALAEARIDARHISYIEAHGTGTRLGDPIEIAGLSKAFLQYTQDTEFCLIGSAKSNIGHCESAAGIAGLTKVLLQMQHQQIVPSLHSGQLNPHIDFLSTPFRVNQSLRRWERPVIDGRELPRIAGISSFGAGGSNAHMIVEEYEAPPSTPVVFAQVVILLSARTPEQLEQKARDLLQFIRTRHSAIDLVAMAYTLQVGREAREERLGFMAKSLQQVVDKLAAFVSGEQAIEEFYQGEVKRNQDALSLFSSDADLQETVEKWISHQKFTKLLDLWVKGLEVDWNHLYGGAKPQRMSLPTYPFAKERYWIDLGALGPAQAAGAILHPLLHRNTSNLTEQSYASTFTGDEWFLADHQVQLAAPAPEKVLPGVAYLEMARIAIEEALPVRPEAAVLELQNVVWVQPFVVNGGKQIRLALSAGDSHHIDYEIYSQNSAQQIVHCQGHATWWSQAMPAKLDLAQLKGQMGEGQLGPDSIYPAFAWLGLTYGPTFQAIEAIHRGSGQVLAQLRLPGRLADQLPAYVLHPALLDGALQAAVGLIDADSESTHARLPFALESLRIISPCTPEMFAWVRYASCSQPADKVASVDIDLCDERGNVCAQMRGFSARVLGKDIRAVPAQQIGSLLLAPTWQTSGTSGEASSFTYSEHHVILCELSNVNIGELGSLFPGSECLSLAAGEHKTPAQRYTEYALACFERIQGIFRGKPEGTLLVQIVVAVHGEQALFAGLAALLKTAMLENPQLEGQLLLVAPQTTTRELARQLQEQKTGRPDSQVRYEHGVRQILRWQEVPSEAEKPPVPFKDQGIYLITGGLGALGLLFAKEILKKTHHAHIVLTGRGALSAETQIALDDISETSGRLNYRQLDIGDPDQVGRLIAAIMDEYHQLHGILHCAGMIADNFILKKSSAEFSAVLAPKVVGVYNLDQASQDVELDFFVLFSSAAAVLGNPGQVDYAAANGFMDEFAAHRNRQVAAGKRHGRTRSINWPLWQAGGMGLAPPALELLQQTTGMQPMQTAVGLETFYRTLALPYDQTLVVEGDLALIRSALRVLLGASPVASFPQAEKPAADAIDAESLTAKTQDYLRKQFSGLLKLPSHKIDSHAPLEQYGIDSIMAMKLTNQLEQTFGSLSKTLFFEYQTISGLAGYLAKAFPAILRVAIGPSAVPTPKGAETAEGKRSAPAVRGKHRFFQPKTNDQKDIAVIGLAGRYPQAENLQEFWKNLQNGRDCITEIPADRWNHKAYYDPDKNKLGKTYSKWGGFIADVDKFDPLFFNISPKEAELIDPQERLFLETVWQAVEDAGYSKEALSAARVGVFVGVMWGQYDLFGAESILKGNTTVSYSSHASVANRVSYFFDLHGPSIALDTMCSSSLTAIHMACEELRKGEIEAAIAGGVNLTIHPYKYLSLSQGRFVASDGKCRSFGEGGDGYVPGEGVGAVLLKPLQAAIRDRDQIYAVIKSSTVNHGGKTNGYSVPNPNAQADLIIDALKKANLDPTTLSYIETHGTGTSLGDPIEITGLSKAFAGVAQEKQFCPIGSVKSNIGHLESAAGIAAVTKALLQIRHKQLVPSLHSSPLNPNINFQDSPFHVQTKLAEWKHTPLHPRRVGVSSFGAGGSNAHLILEEHSESAEPENSSTAGSPEVFVLSARDHDALCRYAGNIRAFLHNRSGLSLADVAYTAQVGRTPMQARLAVVTSSVQELADKLNEWLALQKVDGINSLGSVPELENVFSGNIKDAHPGASSVIEGPSGQAFLENLLANRDLSKIATLWTLGVAIDWSLMPRLRNPRRISLPTYPFARERCWVKQEAPSTRPLPETTQDTSKVAFQPSEEKKHKTYYELQWALKPFAAAAHTPPPLGPILVLDSSDGLFLTMRRTVKNDSIVLLKPGKSFRAIEPGIYTIDPEREENFADLIQTLKSKTQLPGVVIHHCAQPYPLQVQQQLAEQLNSGFYLLFNLCKALMKETHQAPLRILSVFSSFVKAPAPLGAAMGGFFRTLALENPNYRAKVVDVQTRPGENAELFLSKRAEVIWHELHDEDWSAKEIRHRHDAEEDDTRNRRYRSELVLSTPTGECLSDLPLRKNGVYLITGGLGGLGLIFAEYLARHFQARLVLLGRSAPNAGQKEKLNLLQSYGAEVMVLQADVSSLEDMQRVVSEVKARFAVIHGVLHSAGVNRDAFILNKTRQEIEAVLAPKVHGAVNLDLVTSDENLDLFVLFSSVASVMGNLGQSDYAFANRFLDFFAEMRESLRAVQKRSGRTLSINWPYWEEGGMRISRDGIALVEERTGISPLTTQDGIQYWEDFLRSETLQGIPLYGTPSRIAGYIARNAEEVSRNLTSPATEPGAATLVARTEAYLKTLIGEEIKLAPERIGSTDRLSSFGIDSVMIARFNSHLEEDLGALPKTLLYEYETVQELAAYLLHETGERLMALFAVPASEAQSRISLIGMEEEAIQHENLPTEEKHKLDRIAIVGISGYFPHSPNLDEYWENLQQGRKLTDLVPRNRWDYQEFYHPNPAAASDGKIYCKWGGFLDDFDKFDPTFFNISPDEARLMDPQERLFLESAWAAIEDAGYTRDSLKKLFPKAKSADVGVFVGVTTHSYNLCAPEKQSGGATAVPGALPWSIANRVSYCLDFNGPSMPVDTACSSSLVALHLACESIRNGECRVAIAGGVNLYLHPSKYLSLCQRRMLSLRGQCQSYGAGDDGFVPGEGVGSLVLKPLSRAIEDQDQIYAVIPASAYSHSGRSNGYSAPNPNSQASLISKMLKKANIHPETISYVEGHGTGTQLGDSLEVAALTQAFQQQTSKKQFCPIGSVKANIGHSESAAGIAGLAKVILQLKHRQLAPSIGSDEANSDIEFEQSPFYLQRGLTPWEATALHPRRALINSFGAGGVNACVILEEYCDQSSCDKSPRPGPYLFVLSAKDESRLQEYVDRLLARLNREHDIDLASLCYTLQVGREAMEERLAIVVSGVEELMYRLHDWKNRRSSSTIYRGSLGPGGVTKARLAKPALGKENLSELAALWATGGEVEWESINSSPPPRRVSLPVYPFARERYWIAESQVADRGLLSNVQLHPLISYNSSTMKEVSFTSVLSHTEFYAFDHEVNGQRIFPGTGLLELACISGNIAGERRVRQIEDVVWIHPVVFRKGSQTLRTSLRNKGESIEYVISSFDDEDEMVVHSEGRLTFANDVAHPGEVEDRLSVETMKAQCSGPEDGAAYYAQLREYGFNYGPGFQTIQEIYVSQSFALSKLKIADHLKADFSQFILHPSILDGALQTTAALLRASQAATPYLPFALDQLDILHPIRHTCYVYAEFAPSDSQHRAGVRKFTVRLLNESGDVLIKFTNLSMRALKERQGNPRSRLAPGVTPVQSI